ncbi:MULTISPECIES: roadblock/LC7 domain-containing protein [Streptomyces]|jgi:predicted regulator of Ras-like GTPase activity (Roadblock/LC7/MglB family)|uniref:roadblock/LC7 domain-containing protein n=1 Tax=Streptomyces TaxID=1883 RepID=UPI0033AA41B0
MTSASGPDRTTDLNWLLNDMVRRVPQVGHAIVLSTDGLLLASSDGLGRDPAQQLSAVASGFHSLAKGTGRHFGGGAVLQTVVEMEHGYLFVCAAGENACLAVLTPEGADIGLVAFEMARLVGRVGQHLAVGSRPPAPSAAD